ncbi:E3 ubiquitin-protein ligase rnf168 [Amphiprion ocellaris]|uniref:E3 ubiquitin-protein ligase rnf168 n=1 Tax=Amphiprion ocellaris TaxID=80972 RepID=UPI000C309B88|nr:E3 ubiquitin-protein ligase rnf168 [Amphiprion ocellaris]XP_023126462.1 E3 ubiquitin-protein ligase rnf168 [Amphiprion ocellaris]XP_023126463.1 E3 ubiquitin-protein ligase rnf168 [Amphiprion ocellaris]XP_023126464.1 E3 ubiquitin-protein ligase rnf168 [Amphiprion ocellaris]
METLSQDDCLCPVCLEIFMEPVTLPCSHTFCKACFLESVDKATLCCPLCRRRVSTWARLNSRTNSLVNQQLWQQIQDQFPLQCQRRLSGQDAVDDDHPVSVCLHRLSEPGELRQEYEDQITKLTEEKRVLEEQQRRASEELIQKLLEEEEELLQEEERKRQEDERLARLLSTQLNSPPVFQQNLRPDVIPAQKKKEVGQIERFLCPRAPPTCSLQSNKENILVSEGAQQPELPLPHLDYYGPQAELCPLQEEDHLTAPGEPSSAKRKNSELDTTAEEENDVAKRRCHPSSLEAGLVLQGAAQGEAELQGRWQQEEEDRRLALLLQKELDKEERQKAIDRRKGSANAHLLRQRRQTRNEAAGSSGTTSLNTGSAGAKRLNRVEATGSSSVSPKTSSFRRRKQKTLTEMFSSLSS